MGRLKPKKCAICGAEINGYGNNAEPICDGICCDACNSYVVIPKRMEMLKELKRERRKGK